MTETPRFKPLSHHTFIKKENDIQRCQYLAGRPCHLVAIEKYISGSIRVYFTRDAVPYMFFFHPKDINPDIRVMLQNKEFYFVKVEEKVVIQTKEYDGKRIFSKYQPKKKNFQNLSVTKKKSPTAIKVQFLDDIYSQHGKLEYVDLDNVSSNFFFCFENLNW